MPFAPRRVVSLQPSVSVTLADLDALDCLGACTKHCVDILPQLADGTRHMVADSWSSNTADILSATPDLVIASVPYRMESLAEIMRAGVPVLALAPKSLDDIYRDIQLIAGALSIPERAAPVIERMTASITRTRELTADVTRPRVYCEEWGKPLIQSQHWVAELVNAAGGEFIGTPGAQTTAADIATLDPDVILTAWCGAGDRVPLERIVEQRGWHELRAVRVGRVYCINDEYLNTPATTLIHGLAALLAAIHPELRATAPGLRRIAH